MGTAGSVAYTGIELSTKRVHRVIIVYYIDYWSILVSQLYRLPYKIKFVRVYTNILPFKLVSNFIPVKTGQQLYINI